MSRALARLRQALGDPLLVRAGRNLVPTPRALELRVQAAQLVQHAQAVLRPAARLDLQQLVRTFTLASSDGFVENFGPELLRRVCAQAPGVRLHFVSKPGKDGSSLRDGRVDLETGVVGQATDPALRSRALFGDRFVGVVRSGHALATGAITASRYAVQGHVMVSRRGQTSGPLDEALQALGLSRTVLALVGGFSAALALARDTDLVASVPERHTDRLRAGMHTFALPFASAPLTVSMLWHPRMDADAAHHWLRDCLREVCARPPG